MSEEQLRIEERLEELEENPPRYNTVLLFQFSYILSFFVSFYFWTDSKLTRSKLLVLNFGAKFHQWYDHFMGKMTNLTCFHLFLKPKYLMPCEHNLSPNLLKYNKGNYENLAKTTATHELWFHSSLLDYTCWCVCQVEISRIYSM